MPDLFPYQEVGRDFLRANQFAFLADQPGLGKTPQAVRAAQAKCAGTGVHPKICVICPKAAIENWRREIRRWWPIKVIDDDMIVNFDLLALDSKERTLFEAGSWDIIIIDEAHRLKTAGAKRTQNIYRHIARLKKKNPQLCVWLLSGTPAKNHAGELWTHLAILRPDLIRDRSGRVMAEEQFQEKYCRVGHDAHGHRRIFGSKNIRELRKLLDDSGFLLRRRKKDVQSQLPDLIFDEYPLPGNQPSRYAGGGMHNQITDSMTTDEVLEYLGNHAQSLAEWRHDVAQVKLPLVKDFVETELETPGEKMIVFFHHTVLGRELHHQLAGLQPVIVDGKTKNAQAEVDVFQEDPNCRLFIGQISACQEALNITAATQVAFAEAAWSPSDNYQAACRAHRIGMGDSLIVRFLSLAGSTDEIVQRVLARKAIELAELFD